VLLSRLNECLYLGKILLFCIFLEAYKGHRPVIFRNFADIFTFLPFLVADAALFSQMLVVYNRITEVYQSLRALRAKFKKLNFFLPDGLTFF